MLVLPQNMRRIPLMLIVIGRLPRHGPIGALAVLAKCEAIGRFLVSRHNAPRPLRHHFLLGFAFERWDEKWKAQFFDFSETIKIGGFEFCKK